MRVKDIIEVEDLKKTELPKDLEVTEDNKPSRIRNGLRQVGRYALDAMIVVGGVATLAGVLLPAVGLAGAAVSEIGMALTAAATVGQIAEAVSNTAGALGGKSQPVCMEA